MLSDDRDEAPRPGHATIAIHGTLADFLPAPRRAGAIDVAFRVAPTVKDALEALGVPHPEVDRIEADGASVGFGWRLHDGAQIDAYPVPDGIVRADHVGLVPASPRPLRFILDTHLGRLAGHLRMLGFDTAYATDAADEDLAQRSAAQGRILLTRDRGLLRRGVVRHGYAVRSDAPRQQLDEIVHRYDLRPVVAPFTRCIRCNGLIAPVAREEVDDLLHPRTRRYYDEFGRCGACGTVYWKGSHYARMRRLVDEVMGAAQPGAGTS